MEAHLKNVEEARSNNADDPIKEGLKKSDIAGTEPENKDKDKEDKEKDKEGSEEKKDDAEKKDGDAAKEGDQKESEEKEAEVKMETEDAAKAKETDGEKEKEKESAEKSTEDADKEKGKKAVETPKDKVIKDGQVRGIHFFKKTGYSCPFVSFHSTAIVSRYSSSLPPPLP